MEGVAMLRQLIGQLQEVLELYGSPPPTVPSNYFIQFQPTSHHQPLRSLLISPFFLLIFGFIFSCFEWRGFGFYFHFYKLFHFCFWVRLSSSKPIFLPFNFCFLVNWKGFFLLISDVSYTFSSIPRFWFICYSALLWRKYFLTQYVCCEVVSTVSLGRETYGKIWFCFRENKNFHEYCLLLLLYDIS